MPCSRSVNVSTGTLAPSERSCCAASLEFGIYALYPSRKHVSPKVRLLIDYLVASLKRKTWSD
jgi:DNA-binding transcriptional LysR family regulator